MQIKNDDLFRLKAGLEGVGALPGIRFGYAVAKNLRKVTALCDDLKAGLAPTPEFAAYQGAHRVLVEQHAKKDERGQAIGTTEGQETRYQIEDPAAFAAAMATLQAEHGPALDARAKLQAEFVALMQESSEVDVYKIRVRIDKTSGLPLDKDSGLPDEITGDQLGMIWEVLEEVE